MFDTEIYSPVIRVAINRRLRLTKRTSPIKTTSSHASAPGPSATATDGNLQATVSQIQETVTLLANAFTNFSNSAQATYGTDMAHVEGAEEGEISDLAESIHFDNLAPGRGNDGSYHNDTVPESGDNFSERNVDTVLLGQEIYHLLNELAALIENYERVGPAINEQLAQTVNVLIRGKIQAEKLNEKLKLYNRPENYTNMYLTRVNTEIWSILKPTTRSHDAKRQKIQNSFIHRSVRDELLKARKKKSDASIDSAKLIRNLIDTIASLGNVNSLLNCQRNSPSQNFALLCSSQVPCTNLLFGEDLAQSCKSIRSTGTKI